MANLENLSYHYSLDNLRNLIEDCKEGRINTAQVFLGPPQKLMVSSLPEELEVDIRELTLSGKLRIFVHLPYIINLASLVPDVEKTGFYRLTKKTLVNIFAYAQYLGAMDFILHAGSTKTTQDPSELVRGVQAMLYRLDDIAGFAHYKGVKVSEMTIHVETTAGGGTSIGDPTIISAMVSMSSEGLNEKKFKIGICVDLAHCLSKNQEILTKEYGYIEIYKVVRDKLNCSVLSLNRKTMGFEWKKVINWFQVHGQKQNISLKVKGFKSICSTLDHPFLTGLGMVKAVDLKIGDKLAVREKKLSYEQKQLVFGSLLGDACLHANRGKSNRFQISQGQRQKDYFLFKKGLMSHFFDKRHGSSRDDFSLVRGNRKRKNGEDTFSYKSSSVVSRVFDSVHDITNTGEYGFKRITSEWLDNVDLMGLTFWYLDDGSLRKYNTKKGVSGDITITVGKFRTLSGKNSRKVEITLDEVQLLVDKLNSFDFEASYREHERQFTVHLTARGTKVFMDLCSQYIPSCMGYKAFDICGSYWFRYEFQELFEIVFYPVEILERNSWKKGGTFYDIEVEDNHNFLVHDVVCSNCFAAGIDIYENEELMKKYSSIATVCHFNLPDKIVTLASHRDRHKTSFKDLDYTPEQIKMVYEHFKLVPCIIEQSSGEARESKKYVEELYVN